MRQGDGAAHGAVRRSGSRDGRRLAGVRAFVAALSLGAWPSAVRIPAGRLDPPGICGRATPELPCIDAIYGTPIR